MTNKEKMMDLKRCDSSPASLTQQSSGDLNESFDMDLTPRVSSSTLTGSAAGEESSELVFGRSFSTPNVDSHENQDVLNQLRASALSPKNNKASGPNVLLTHEWTIWFDKITKSESKGSTLYEDCIVELGSFQSVNGFWSYWQTLRVESLKHHCNLRIFRKGVKPLWDDPKNINGGKWVVRNVPTHLRKGLWTDMALVLIADKIQEFCTSDVCGVVLSTREEGDSLQIWIDDTNGNTHLGERLHKIFFADDPEAKYSTFVYQTHKELHGPYVDPTEDLYPASPTEHNWRQVQNDALLSESQYSPIPVSIKSVLPQSGMAMNYEAKITPVNISKPLPMHSQHSDQTLSKSSSIMSRNDSSISGSTSIDDDESLMQYEYVVSFLFGIIFQEDLIRHCCVQDATAESELSSRSIFFFFFFHSPHHIPSMCSHPAAGFSPTVRLDQLVRISWSVGLQDFYIFRKTENRKKSNNKNQTKSQQRIRQG